MNFRQTKKHRNKTTQREILLNFFLPQGLKNSLFIGAQCRCFPFPNEWFIPRFVYRYSRNKSSPAQDFKPLGGSFGTDWMKMFALILRFEKFSDRWIRACFIERDRRNGKSYIRSVRCHWLHPQHRL